MTVWTIASSGVETGDNWRKGTVFQGCSLIVGQATSEPGDFIGSELNSVTVSLKNATNPSPAVQMTMTVYDSTGTVKETSGTVSSDDLTTSFTEHTFTFSSPLPVLASGDLIGLTLPYSSYPAPSDDWKVEMNTGNGNASTIFWSAPFSQATASNAMAGTYTYGAEAAATVLLPPPYSEVRF